MQKSEDNYNMIDWWKKVVFQNYANFSGRARRSEYWYFVLGQACLVVPVYILLISGFAGESEEFSMVSLSAVGLFFLGTFIPGLAVTVRRLHDTNKSGWYYFVVLIPFGSIALLIWMFQEGNPFQNQYGEDPKRPDGPVFDFERNQTTKY